MAPALGERYKLSYLLFVEALHKGGACGIAEDCGADVVRT